MATMVQDERKKQVENPTTSEQSSSNNRLKTSQSFKTKPIAPLFKTNASDATLRSDV